MSKDAFRNTLKGITLEEEKILLKKLRRLYSQKPEIKSQFKDKKENQTKTKP